MTYILAFMVILETPVFTKQITALISDDSYAELQQTIRLDPETGAIIAQETDDGFEIYTIRDRNAIPVPDRNR